MRVACCEVGDDGRAARGVLAQQCRRVDHASACAQVVLHLADLDPVPTDLDLVGVWCLGVKNAHPVEAVTASQLAEYRHAYIGAFEWHVQVPAEVACALVFGAAGHACGLGFDPAEDFEAAAAVLGEPAGSCPIGIGKDGEPFYVNGPYDDPEQVVRMLLRAVGDGGSTMPPPSPSSRGAGGCEHAGSRAGSLDPAVCPGCGSI